MATTTTVLASSYSGMTNITTNASYPITNAYTNSSSTNYAQLTLSKKNGESTIDFGFDFSAIPANAKVTAVTAKFKGIVNSTSYVSAATVQAHKNGVAVGSSTAYRSTTATVYTLSVGSWTRSELDTMTLYVTGKKANTNSAAYIRVYGMEVAVTWEEPTQELYYKDNGTWKTASAVYKKIGGAWVLQNDLSTVFDPNTNYVRGN